jgi:hypothetical protein
MHKVESLPANSGLVFLFKRGRPNTTMDDTQNMNPEMESEMDAAPEMPEEVASEVSEEAPVMEGNDEEAAA